MRCGKGGSEELAKNLPYAGGSAISKKFCRPGWRGGLAQLLARCKGLPKSLAALQMHLSCVRQKLSACHPQNLQHEHCHWLSVFPVPQNACWRSSVLGVWLSVASTMVPMHWPHPAIYHCYDFVSWITLPASKQHFMTP